MVLRFTVLASGSSGNTSLLEANGFGVLVDAGLGPRQLADRLAAVDAGWQRVQAVLLTHTHGDHWHDRTLDHLRRRRIPLYCHPEHQAALRTWSAGFGGLQADGLVHPYEVGQDLRLGNGLACRPFRVRHDNTVTCGFRFEAAHDLFGQACALGYAADLGCWQGETARALANVDVLAVEFNHDVTLQHASGRSPRLVRRVLGDDGHLSNVQAAALVREAIRLSEKGRLRHLIQLHLSRDCNRPALAVAAAAEAVQGCDPAVEIHTARQDQPGPCLAVSGPGPATFANRPRKPRVRRPGSGDNGGFVQTWLPGWESA